MSFHKQIHETERNVTRLHARLHETLGGGSQAARKQAVDDLHAYVSPIDALVNRCYTEQLGSNREQIGFALDFLECDPVYFRSGYLKERLLDRLKSATLTATDRERLRRLLMDAVLTRGRREFRRYCKLAAVVQTEEFEEALRSLLDHPEQDVRSRARLMIDYLKCGA